MSTVIKSKKKNKKNDVATITIYPYLHSPSSCPSPIRCIFSHLITPRLPPPVVISLSHSLIFLSTFIPSPLSFLPSPRLYPTPLFSTPLSNLPSYPRRPTYSPSFPPLHTLPQHPPIPTTTPVPYLVAVLPVFASHPLRLRVRVRVRVCILKTNKSPAL